MNKTYIKPETSVISIATENCMMAASGENLPISDKETGSVNAKGYDFDFNVWGTDEEYED